jgi:hypothetical protein
MRSFILHIIQRKKWVINHIIQRNVENKQHFAIGSEKHYFVQKYTYNGTISTNNQINLNYEG